MEGDTRYQTFSVVLFRLRFYADGPIWPYSPRVSCSCNNNAFVSHMCHPARRLGGAGCSSSTVHRTLLIDHARAANAVSCSMIDWERAEKSQGRRRWSPLTKTRRHRRPGGVFQLRPSVEQDDGTVWHPHFRQNVFHVEDEPARP